MDDADGAAAAELARQLLIHAPPGDSANYNEWVGAAVTAMCDDRVFARLVLTALTITGAAALFSLDAWSPGARAAVLRLDGAQR